MGILIIGVNGILAILISLAALALAITSLVRMKRNRGKYLLFSKIIAYISLTIFGMFAIGLLEPV